MQTQVDVIKIVQLLALIIRLLICVIHAFKSVLLASMSMIIVLPAKQDFTFMNTLVLMFVRRDSLLMEAIVQPVSGNV